MDFSGDWFGFMTFALAAIAMVAAVLGVVWYAKDRRDIREGILEASKAITQAREEFTPEVVERRAEAILGAAVEKYQPLVDSYLDSKVGLIEERFMVQLDKRAEALLPRIEAFGNNLLATGVGGFQEVMVNLAQGIASVKAQEYQATGVETRRARAEVKKMKGFKNHALREITSAVVGQGDPIKEIAIKRGLELAEEHGIDPEEALSIGAALLEKFQGGSNTKSEIINTPKTNESAGGWG